MSRKILIAVTAVVVVLLFMLLPASYAQSVMKWKGSGGWGSGTGYGRMYDPSTIETVRGEVVRVEKITPQKGMSYGIHLILKTDKETIPVHLGPGWFIEKQDVKIEPKDQVEVIGSRVTIDNKPVIIAAEVKKGDQILKLRDEKTGYPVWSGWKR